MVAPGLTSLRSEYLEYLAVRGYSPTTLATVGNVLKLFVAWCSDRGIERPIEVTRPVIERYQRYLYHHRRPNGKALGFRTQHQRLVHLKGFFAWLVREHVLLYSPAAELELPRYARHLPTESLTVEEVERLLQVPDLASPLGVRDRALLETLYSTGMRRMEVIGLDLYDLDQERGWVVIRSGKGRKDRVVPIGDRALAWVRKYLEEGRPELVVDAAETALFLSVEGRRFASGGLSHHVRRMLVQAGITKRGSCHVLRHTMATLMLENGADIRYIQEMLGHAKLDTTQIYTQVTIHQLKKVHEATHPARLERRSTLAEELIATLDEESAEDELAE
jgi:integrase/recombinase XerD